jgi:general secretion pathway protein G
MANRSRRALTLIEIMIVLFLIGMVISVLTYSMKGSMDEGKCFKARQRALQIEQLLMMASAQTGLPLDAVIAEPKKYLESTGLVKDGTPFLQDPWGQQMQMAIQDDRIVVWSDQYEKLMRKKHGPDWVEKRD